LTKDERAERSRLRAEQYERRRRTKAILVIAALVIYVVVPLLWNGAIEFGLVHPIRTPEFKSALSLAGTALLIVGCYMGIDLLKPRKSAKKQKPEALVPKSA
jgi:hypothetical protein